MIPAAFFLQRLESTQCGTFQQGPQGHSRWHGMSSRLHQKSLGQWVPLVLLLNWVMMTLLTFNYFNLCIHMSGLSSNLFYLKT